MAIDLVCGMTVDEKQAAGTSSNEGATYYFYSPGCRDKFVVNPAGYVAAIAPATAVLDPNHAHVRGGQYDNVPVGYTGTVYTCPMHPEVRQTEVGACPLCGMGLEPERAAGAEESPNPELIDFTRRLWVGVIFNLPLLALTMTPYHGITAIREFFGERAAMWIKLALGTPVILYPFFSILIGPIFAAFAMSASSISVVLNSLRLRRVSL